MGGVKRILKSEPNLHQFSTHFDGEKEPPKGEHRWEGWGGLSWIIVD